MNGIPNRALFFFFSKGHRSVRESRSEPTSVDGKIWPKVLGLPDQAGFEAQLETGELKVVAGSTNWLIIFPQETSEIQIQVVYSE